MKTSFITIYRNTVNSIWIVPAIISALFFGLIYFILAIHSPDHEYRLLQIVPYGDINNADTARALVTTILAGTISLIIFSFTMMMFVLNQAASNYSAKVLGGLISQKSNQIVLGVYIGTVIYTIILLMQIKEGDNFKNVPHIAIFLCVVIFIFCLILFVKFINNIYNSVQIYSVINRIYSQTKKELQKESDNKTYDKNKFLVKEWFDNVSNKSGYFQTISGSTLVDIACKHDLVVQSIPPKGFYHVAGAPLFRLSKKITDKKILGKIEDGFAFYTGENIKDNYFYGLRQLSEVAIQALSTGINAPGTAIACLEHLSDLFSIRMKQDHSSIYKDKKNDVRVIVPEIPFAELLEICISPIRIYGKKDVNMVLSLINFLKNLSYNDPAQLHQDLLSQHVLAVYEDAFKNLENSMDKKSVKEKMRELKNLPSNYFIELNLQPHF
ncbi:MAG: DUF2254 domain-containing protein [Bacteroidota bacterium]|nr:DUF2254 domain-containing protein [Bacteroidota bacterium]